MTGGYVETASYGARVLPQSNLSSSNVFVFRINNLGAISSAVRVCGRGASSVTSHRTVVRGIAASSADGVLLGGEFTGHASFGPTTLTEFNAAAQAGSAIPNPQDNPDVFVARLAFAPCGVGGC